ncbi:hypothetical protein MTO96_013393 [Rhipicephalus appendiculatus]
MSSYRMIRSASSATTHNGHPQHYKASEVLRFARRTPYHHQPVISSGYSQAVARRNERERNRVRLVNMGFAALRQHVPNFTQNKKMSKGRHATDRRWTTSRLSKSSWTEAPVQQRHGGSERDVEDDDDSSYKADQERRHGMTSFEDAEGFYDFSRIGEDNAPSSPAGGVLQPSEMSESSASALDCYGADDAELMDFCQPWLV